MAAPGTQRGSGHNTLPPASDPRGTCRMENNISPLSYHTCNYTMTTNVSTLVAFQMPYKLMVPCGGWIPWKRCSKTKYKTEYRSIQVPETSNVTRCCEGYEHVGDYCALSFERFSEFASRPGMCPTIAQERTSHKCASDVDCPWLQKCCNVSSGFFCASCTPRAHDRNTVKHWYNGTVTIKMGFDELRRVDPGFLNHTRLLHSMITGELGPLKTLVHHIATESAGTFAVRSYFHIGINESDSLGNISSKLNNIVTRLPEVIDIKIEEMLESPPSATDEPVHGYSPTNHSTPLVAASSIFRNLSISNVTSSGFHIQWNTDGPENHTYNVQVSALKGVHLSNNTNQTHMEICDLGAGELYAVRIQWVDTKGQVHLLEENVKTASSIFRHLSISNVTSNGFHIQWNTDGPENNTYNVQVSALKGVHLSNNTNQTHMEICDLGAGELYAVRIQWVDTKGQVHLLEENVKTASSIFRHLSISNVTSNGFHIQWNTDGPENNTYNVQVSALKGVHLSNNTNQTHMEICDLGAGELYAVRIQWVDTKGQVHLLEENVKTASSIFRNLSISNVTSSGFHIQWNTDGPENNTYNVQVSALKGVHLSNNTNQTHMEICGLGAGELYAVRIQWVDTKGQVHLLEENIKTASSIFRNLSISNVTSNGFHIQWNTDGHENNTYNVQVSALKGVHLSNNTNQTHMEICGLGAGELYAVRIRWVDTKGQVHLLEENVKTASSIFRNLSISNVTSNGFHIQWNTDGHENNTYNVQVSALKGVHSSNNTNQTHMEICGLGAGELYAVRIRWVDIKGQVHLLEENIKTEAQILSGTLKITNGNFTKNLLNSSSTEYVEFVRKFIEEVKKSLCKKVAGDTLTVEVQSLSAGSIIVQFLLKIPDSNTPINITASSFSSVNESGSFVIDPKSILIADFDECSSPSENDCGVNAECKNLEVSYTCQCYKSYVDTNPTRPGRNCEDTNIPSSSTKSMALDTGNVHFGTTSVNQTLHSSTIVYTTHLPTETSEPIKQIAALQDPTRLANRTIFNANSSGVFTMSPAPWNTTTIYTSPNTVPEYVTNHSSTGGSNPVSVANTETPNKTQPASSVLASTSVILSAVTITSPDVHTGSFPNFTLPSTPTISISHSTLQSHASTSASLTPHPNPTTETLKPHSNELSTDVTTTLMSSDIHMSLKEASNVLCEVGTIGIAIQRTYLKKRSITESSLYLGAQRCNVSSSNDSHVLLRADWKECGIEVHSTKTQTVVNTTLYIVLTSTVLNGIHPSVKSISSIRCVFQNDILASSGYNPERDLTIYEDIQGDGSFVPDFQMFNGDQPIPKNQTLSARDDIVIKIGIKEGGSQFKVVITECWATPTSNEKDPISFLMINKSCALPNTFTTIINNGVSMAEFKTTIFALVDTAVVYLHCRLYVCKETDPGTCKTSCDSVRSVRSSEKVISRYASYGPLYQASRTTNSITPHPPKESPLGPGYIALIIVVIFAFVAGGAAILVFWHQRRTGIYKFKINFREVGYQVFYG
ncbi:uromodulin-like 1 isoform X3 [Ascaphus truei]|uniref:uromodulin-like 1 isoform X3 n=1 Tax=Ascaphus truei TaxID=8439 RepID=UPI003F5A4F95